MRYDRLLDALQKTTAKYESEVRRLIAASVEQDSDTDAAVLRIGKARAVAKRKDKAKGWTPERRAAQSRRIKALMRRRKREAQG